MKKYKLIILVSVFSLLTSGCSEIKAGIAAIRSTDHFIVSEIDSRVRYEPDAHQLADNVVSLLPSAIKLIEENQYRPFTSTVEVVVYESKESIGKYTGCSKEVRGCEFMRRVHISPKAAQKNSVRETLVHELSHLHLDDNKGLYAAYRNIPTWFREGLAVTVSNGGAENVSREKAAHSIINGKSFSPEMSGNILFIKHAASYGLDVHMFYRQSNMFVEYLELSNSSAFRQFFKSVDDGEKFETAFISTYGKSIEEAWAKFKKYLEEKYPGA